jgi:hypothetical protein
VQDAEFSDEFCKFLQKCVPSVDAAELLLVLARQPELEWQAQTLVERKPRDLNLTQVEAAKYLEFFQGQGLLSATPETHARFQPATAELSSHVLTLAKAYNERPVTLIRMIYALRDTQIHSFSDAFRLRNT